MEFHVFRSPRALVFLGILKSDFGAAVVQISRQSAIWRSISQCMPWRSLAQHFNHYCQLCCWRYTPTWLRLLWLNRRGDRVTGAVTMAMGRARTAWARWWEQRSYRNPNWLLSCDTTAGVPAAMSVMDRLAREHHGIMSLSRYDGSSSAFLKQVFNNRFMFSLGLNLALRQLEAIYHCK